MKVTEETRQLLHRILERSYMVDNERQVPLAGTPEGRQLYVLLSDPMSEDQRREQMLQQITHLQAHNSELLQLLRDAKKLMERMVTDAPVLAMLAGQVAAQHKLEPNQLAQRLLDTYAAEGARMLLGESK